FFFSYRTIMPRMRVWLREEQDYSTFLKKSSRQSPVNIVPGHVKTDENLGNFTFVNFSTREVFHNIVNTGHTVQINLKESMVEIHGGGLNGVYVMHVVALKKGLTTEDAMVDPEGIAVLGFLIEVRQCVHTPYKKGPWSNLTSHLMNSTEPVNLTDAISMTDLIGDVDLTKFYRYKGSLTTPMCNEVVIWTVFVEPIHVHADLLQLFPTKTHLTNRYQPTKALSGRQIYASPAVELPAG
uniref:Alpha-carbonic anhydrase domain-containing protein n=1 Tax=Neogobius melanostomus TaxID=47308 RepID=A0A8C6UQH5_9GOBI